ncbi:gamma-glutamyltransferase [Luteitalea sp. TBR-22]|uniref:gamma-glutamyltransferase n=1 Tax=Luteitalea sp. TBR-22 TaxID=2802971 RepID=UPI001EF690C7|nr:gamma-glutamyltransferase [Luteitalea sp. TBR-22]
MHTRYAASLLLLALAVGCARPTTPEATAGSVPAAWPHRLDAPVATGEHGMVVTDAPLATQVGLDVLRAGGTAVDASIAVAFALAVVWPEAGNVGGGGLAVLHVNGSTTALDFRETAPGAAHRDMYLDAAGAPTDRSVTGHLAAGVPGSVAGLWELHRRHGTRPWADLLQPAIALAEQGFLVGRDVSGDITAEASRLARFPESARLFLPGGAPLAPEARLANPDLARVLSRIAQRGRDGFYTGETADLLVAEMRRGGGIITHDDLAGYAARWRDPIVFTYRGHRIASMPPPSSGGVTLAMIAQQLESHDLKALGWRSATTAHLQAEAMRRAFAVRNEQLGDSDFVKVDILRLSSRAFAQQLARSIRSDRATPSSEVSGRTGAGPDGPHTTHFSVADRFGNAVALTTTINSGFGSAVTVTGAGFLLNNEMDDFASKPGAPNQFGLVQGEANAIAPGKRMLSAMTPTIVFGGDGAPALVTGASGGPYIITTVFQLLSAIVDHGVDVGAAMSGPRIHHQHLPDAIALEKDGFDAATTAALERLGHRLTFFEVPSTGWTVAATITRKNGQWRGMADPRLHGSAAGY